MAFQQTFLMLRFDAVERGLVGEIISRFERRGYLVVAMRLVRIAEPLARKHYAEHAGEVYFETLIADSIAGPVVAIVLAGEDAIEAVRQMTGAADPRKAAPGTIRGDLAQTIRHNLVHASDTPDSAEREIAFWFSQDELHPRKNPLRKLLRGDD